MHFLASSLRQAAAATHRPSDSDRAPRGQGKASVFFWVRVSPPAPPDSWVGKGMGGPLVGWWALRPPAKSRRPGPPRGFLSRRVVGWGSKRSKVHVAVRAAARRRVGLALPRVAPTSRTLGPSPSCAWCRRRRPGACTRPRRTRRCKSGAASQTIDCVGRDACTRYVESRHIHPPTHPYTTTCTTRRRSRWATRCKASRSLVTASVVSLSPSSSRERGIHSCISIHPPTQPHSTPKAAATNTTRTCTGSSTMIRAS